MKWLHCCQKLTGKRIFINQQLTAPYITATMFVSNFIGICFARTLHYQFYCWYFHAIPYLIWYTTSIVGVTSTKDSIWYHPMLRLSILFTIEMAFLTFPATSYSSFLLQMAHYAILIQIQPPPPCTIVSTPDVATVQTPLYSNKSKQS